MISKKVFNPKSKTHNLGAAMVFFAGLQGFLPDLLPVIPEQYRALIVAGVGLVVIYLRSVTTAPVTEK